MVAGRVGRTAGVAAVLRVVAAIVTRVVGCGDVVCGRGAFVVVAIVVCDAVCAATVAAALSGVLVASNAGSTTFPAV